jgi:acetyltransferase-like isoleucine patch superfamily enzyme
MDRSSHLESESQKKFYEEFKNLHKTLDSAFLENYSRSLPLADTLMDRWERAEKLGFGDRTNIYDSCLVLGKPKVGSDCWIGPNTILDGSGGLEIGNHCTISAGVEIYSHDNVKQTLSSGKYPIERSSVKIENNVYLAPKAVISKGVAIGEFAVIGAFSFVNKSIPPYAIAVGQPAKVIGEVKISKDGEIDFLYFK